MEVVQSSSEAMLIINCNEEASGYMGRRPTTNTLFYIKNNGEISDHSQYNHTMSRYGTATYETLSTGRKVAKFNGSNVVHSANFNEANNKTTFTMHVRMKTISTSGEASFCGWMGRNQSSSSTTDRRGAKRQRDSGSSPYYIIYGPNSSNRASNTSISITPSTTKFDLFTFTVNGGTITIYKNCSRVGSRSGATIRGGSTTGTNLSYGGNYSYNGATGQLTSCYVGEIVLEDKVETMDEIQNFYDKTKKNYGIS